MLSIVSLDYETIISVLVTLVWFVEIMISCWQTSTRHGSAATLSFDAPSPLKLLRHCMTITESYWMSLSSNSLSLNWLSHLSIKLVPPTLPPPSMVFLNIRKCHAKTNKQSLHRLINSLRRYVPCCDMLNAVLKTKTKPYAASSTIPMNAPYVIYTDTNGQVQVIVLMLVCLPCYYLFAASQKKTLYLLSF